MKTEIFLIIRKAAFGKNINDFKNLNENRNISVKNIIHDNRNIYDQNNISENTQRGLWQVY